MSVLPSQQVKALVVCAQEFRIEPAKHIIRFDLLPRLFENPVSSDVAADRLGDLLTSVVRLAGPGITLKVSPGGGLHRLGIGANALERTREGATVEQDVLSGDEAGLCAAQEGAKQSELLGIAEAAGGVLLGALGKQLVRRNTALVGFRFRRAAQPVGCKRSRQQAVDGHVVDDRLARNACDEAGEAG